MSIIKGKAAIKRQVRATSAVGGKAAVARTSQKQREWPISEIGPTLASPE